MMMMMMMMMMCVVVVVVVMILCLNILLRRHTQKTDALPRITLGVGWKRNAGKPFT
jgi:hypothetical protein